jgi:hypothetical protein
MTSTDLSHYSFGEINRGAEKPVLPKDSVLAAKRGEVRLYHAESAVDCPE